MTEKHKEEARKETPERVWITWDDAYPWETPETGGDQYVRADSIREVLEGLRHQYSGCWCPNRHPRLEETMPHEPACFAARRLWDRLQS